MQYEPDPDPDRPAWPERTDRPAWPQRTDWGDADFVWAEPDPTAPAKPRPVDRWRNNTASGAIVAGIALGLQQVFDPVERDTIAIEQEVPDKPGDPGRVELNFDPTDFRATTIVIRLPDAEG